MNSKNLMYFVVVAVIVATSCTGKKTPASTIDSSRSVKVEEAVEQPVDQLINFTAAVQPMKKNLISSSQPNRIQKIYVEVGDRVSKGQKLVDMDAASLIQSRAQLENYERDFKRVDDLYKVGGASKQQVDQMKTQLDVARASFKLLEENVTLVSPINGVVTARNFDDGDMASQPILTVMQTNPVKVLVNISESYYSLIVKGMKSALTLDAIPGETFAGAIGLIHPIMDDATRTFVAEIYIPNANGRIRPGMFGRIEMNLGVMTHVMVKDKAVIKQTGSNEQYVFVFEGGKAVYRKIVVGRRIADRYEIISGVNAGDKVIVDGNTRLQNGMQVSVTQN